MPKMTREEAEKMVGKRTARSGEDKSSGPNWQRRAMDAVVRERSGVGALPADPLRNPGAILEDRLKKAGAYSGGGSVKKYSGGGMVMRGTGAATKGKKFSRNG